MYLQITIGALHSYMAIVLLIQLSDIFCSLKHSEIVQKKIKQFYYDKASHGYIFCKGWYVQILVFSE